MAFWAEVGSALNAPVRERAIGFLTRHLNRFFSVEGLHAYKSKFHPNWEPRYLVYDGDAALPQIALVIVRLTEQGEMIRADRPAPARRIAEAA